MFAQLLTPSDTSIARTPSNFVARKHAPVQNLGRGILLIDVIDPHLGANPTFGFRRFITQRGQPNDRLRLGYSYDRVAALLEGSGLSILGRRHAVAPPALLAHTVFELLRARHFRWYLALLPLLRLVGYSDFLYGWKHGASLMVWAERV